MPDQGYSGADSIRFSASEVVPGDEFDNNGVNTIAVQDTPPAEVQSFSVDSTNWTQPFVQQLPGFVQGVSAGYSVPAGTGQSLDLPWSNLNQVRIQFNENVNVQLGSLTVSGQAVPQYAISGFSYDPTTFTAVWTLAQPIGADHVQVHLSSTGPAAVTDQSGNPLDGEWTNGTSAWPSGDGVPGGDFNFSFNVLPGDVNQDGIVNAQDLALASSGWMKSGMTGDLNGDGIVNGQDLAVLSSNWLETLPPASGGASQPALVTTTGSAQAAIPGAIAASPSSSTIATTGDSAAATSSATAITSAALTIATSQPAATLLATTLLANTVPATATVPTSSAPSEIVSHAAVVADLGETNRSLATALVMTDPPVSATLSSPTAAPPAVDRLAAYLGKSLTAVDAPAADHIFGQQRSTTD